MSFFRPFFLCCCCSVAFATALTNSVLGQQIINVPPTQFFLGDVIGANTVVNVLPGGRLQRALATDGAIVNLIGGEIAALTGESGATISLESGLVSSSIGVGSGAELSQSGGFSNRIFLYNGGVGTISGGTISILDTATSSTLLLQGTDFAIDGVPVAGLEQVGETVTVNVPEGSAFTATLSDGTPFGHYQHLNAVALNGILSFERTADLPVKEPSTTNVNIPSNLASVGSDQTLILLDDGELKEHFRAGPGSRIEVNGGSIETGLHAIGANILLNDGTIGSQMLAFDSTAITIDGGVLTGTRLYNDSTLNILGGAVNGASAYDGAIINHAEGLLSNATGNLGSVINMSGGVANSINIYGGTVNITGGTVSSFSAQETSSSATFSGGRQSDNFSVRVGARMSVHGSNFIRNGAPISDLDKIGNTAPRRLLPGGATSGVYSDGTPFILHIDQEEIEGNILFVETAIPPIAASAFIVPGDSIPNGLRAGQSLTLEDGGELPDNFTAIESSNLTINGGNVGRNLELLDTKAQILGGQLQSIDAFSGSDIEIGGDASWGRIVVHGGANLRVSGQSQGGSIHALPESKVNIESVSLGFEVLAEGSQVEVSGGQVKEIRLAEASNGTFSGGTIESLFVNGDSEAQISNATIGTLSLFESTRVGSIAKAEIEGSKIGTIAAYRGASASVRANVTRSINQQAEMQFHGGALGDEHQWSSGTVELEGFDFQLDGEPVAGLEDTGSSVSLNVPPDSKLTGIFADGSPFNLMKEGIFQTVNVEHGVLLLKRSERPTLASIIKVPADDAPYGAIAGQTVILEAAGKLDDNFVASLGSAVEIRDGMVGENFEAIGSRVNILGGEFGKGMDVFEGAAVTMSNGRIERDFEIHAGGTLNLNGGELGTHGANLGGTFNMTGGVLGIDFRAADGSLANISGGFVERGFNAENGSKVDVSGGTFEKLVAHDGSDVTVSGGSLSLETREGSLVKVLGGNIQRDARIARGSRVEVSGGTIADGIWNEARNSFALSGFSFEINGVSIANLDQIGDTNSVTIGSDDLMTGVLADGTPFVFSWLEGDRIRQMQLVRSADPPPAPSMIQVPADVAPAGVYAGQQIDVMDGGILPDNFGAGRDTVVNIRGGEVGNNLEAFEAVVNVTGGIVGSIDGFLGSEINIDGGTLNSVNAFPGGQVNVVGHSTLGLLDAHSQSTVVVTGGELSRVQAGTGSNVSIHGGSLTGLTVLEGSNIEVSGGRIKQFSLFGETRIFGGRFELNGVPIEDLSSVGDSATVDLGQDLLTGFYADGTPFALSRMSRDGVTVPLALTTVSLPTQEPLDLIASVDSIPLGLRSGQRLTLDAGQELPEHYPVGHGGHLIIEDQATVGQYLETFGATIELVGGTVKRSAQVGPGTTFLVKSGNVEFDAKVYDGATFIVVGGEVTSLESLSGSETYIGGGTMLGDPVLDGGITISGGNFPRYMDVYGNLTLAGGNFSRGMIFKNGSSLIIEGTEFYVDGKQLTELTLDELVHIEPGRLTGTLADGSLFDIFPRNADSVQIKRTQLIGDFDSDGAWTTSDVDHLCLGLASISEDQTLDLNRDSIIDEIDLQRFLEISQSLPGDSNLDGMVDFTDFLVLSASFGLDGNWSDGDVTCDGDVGFDDFLVVSRQFGTAVATVSIPEPGTSFLAFFAMTALLCRNRDA